ncbi:LOW QUALITY PROTEIN: Retrovirus Polyprotein, partial [Phytophthora megakarya]
MRRSPRRRGENNLAVEQGLPHANEMTVEQVLPHANEMTVEQMLPHEAVERRLAYDDSTDAVDHDPLHLEEGEIEISSSDGDSDNSAPSSTSTQKRSLKRRRRRLKPRRTPSPSELLVAQTVNALEYVEGGPRRQRTLEVATPPKDAKSIIQLPDLSWKHFLRDLKADEIEQICIITDADLVSPMVNAASASADIPARPKSAEPKSAREERFETQSSDALRESGNPVHETAREFADIFTDKIPAELLADRGVHHEIDLAPGTKYCVARQWPLPRDQVKAIYDFFENRHQAGHVPSLRIQIRPSVSRRPPVDGVLSTPLTYPTTPLSRRRPQSLGRTYAIDLTDGFYQILMRECDVPLTAGLKNAPATFNRMVSHVLRLLRDFAPSYFDDIFVHSRAEGDLSAMDVHLEHLRQVFQVMRDNKPYTNLKKCIFCAPEVPVLGCYVSKNGVRADPEKVTSIPPSLAWAMANYFHKYTKNYAGLIQPLSSLLKKDATWDWRPEHREAFDAVKTSLASAPILMLPDDSKPFHVVCDASDFAIGCALMQFDDDGRERVVSYQSRQMKTTERNYPVHDKELLAMRYALIKFRVYILGEETFAVYTDHASLRTAMKSPHLSQRMARWLSFFAEYNFVVHYKPGKNNILADALSRRPDYDPRNSLGHQQANDEDAEDACAMCVASVLNLTNVAPELILRAEIANAYEYDTTSKIMNYLRSP